ncbi:MAG: 16S rRNA (uracil(1498)-N(3))-methyltransferase [Steroidobacteraceae bacterium]
MRLIRVHVDESLAEGARVEMRGAAAAHLRRVLRLAAGDAVTLFNGDGADYPSRIHALRRDAVEVEVLGTALARAESLLVVTLVQGIARAERMDLVVQKATELGVAAIQPVAAARSVVKLDAGSRARKAAHWRSIAIAACEQCGRAKLPLLADPRSLASWLQEPAAAGVVRLQLALDARDSLVDAAAGARGIDLLVGPEGGLEETERAAAESAGFRRCRLGPRILRSETAALAALAVLQSVAGDLG